MPLKAMSTWTDIPCYTCDKESYLTRVVPESRRLLL